MKIPKPLIFHLSVFALILTFPSCEKEPDRIPIRYGGLEGVITNAYGNFIEGAIVQIDTVSKTSDNYGRYKFPELEIGEYEVTTSKEFYHSVTSSVEIVEGEIIQLNIGLTADKTMLNLSDSLISTNSFMGSQYIMIESNSSWKVTNETSWITTSRDSGEGKVKLKVYWSRNYELTDRCDTILIGSGSIKRLVIIHQSAPLTITRTESFMGNLETGTKSVVKVWFNKPFQQGTFSLGNPSGASNISGFDNDHGIKFDCSWYRLDENLKYSYSVSDTSGTVYTGGIVVSFYRSLYDLEGFITDYLLIEEDKELLIATKSPARLYKYSIDLDSILMSYDLSGYATPEGLAYNPYNSLIYFYNELSPHIHSFDIQNRRVAMRAAFAPDQHDHPDAPANIPIDLAFTESGLGIAILKANGSSRIRFKMVDCAEGHRIEGLNYTDFIAVHSNFDYTKLVLVQPYGQCDLGIFDQETRKITMLKPSSRTRSRFITTNRKSDRIYVGQLYDQFILGMNGSISQISYLDNRGDVSADFSYREGMESVVYYISNDHLLVMDYARAETLVKCSKGYYLNNFKSTLDGKYGIMYRWDTRIAASHLYVIDLDVLHPDAL